MMGCILVRDVPVLRDDLGLNHAQQIASPLGGIQGRSWGVRPQDQYPCQCYGVRQ